MSRCHKLMRLVLTSSLSDATPQTAYHIAHSCLQYLITIMFNNQYMYSILLLYYYFTYILTPHRNSLSQPPTIITIFSCVALICFTYPYPNNAVFPLTIVHHPFAIMYNNKYIYHILLLYLCYYTCYNVTNFISCVVLYVVSTPSPPQTTMF